MSIRAIATIGLGVVLGLQGLAQAGPIAFNQPYSGPVKLKFSNWDVGTIYDVADGTYTGEATLDGLPQSAPPNKFGIEDSWGVAQLTSIIGLNGNVLLWSNTVSTPEVVALFYGERDQRLVQTTDSFGNITQQIEGKGMQIVFWEDANNDLGSPIGTYSGVGGLTGTARRTLVDYFQGVSEGTVLWTFQSVPGFGIGGNEFFTTFSPSGNTIFGSFNAVGGMLADKANRLAGADGILNTADDLIPTANGLFAGTAGDGIADWRITFTGVADGSGTYHVLSDDPILATVVPEPATMAFLLVGGIGLVGGYLRRRRRLA